MQPLYMARVHRRDVEVRTKAWAAAARLGGEPVSVLPAEAVKAGVLPLADKVQASSYLNHKKELIVCILMNFPPLKRDIESEVISR